MRTTSPPTAPPIATAAVLLAAVLSAQLALSSTASAERWLRPLPGEVARPFSYDRAAPFARGAHRGADLAAAPGAAVRAACAGTVMHAGPVAARGGVVSVRCGGRRVTYQPLARLAVRAGATIPEGAAIGTVGRGHGGLHFGVRRAEDPFGYEDPLRLTERPREPAPPPLPAARPASRGRPARPQPQGFPPHVVPAVPSAVRPRPGQVPAAGPLPAPDTAPWPVWAGLALLAPGLAGSRTVVLRRRRRSAAARLASAGLRG